MDFLLSGARVTRAHHIAGAHSWSRVLPLISVDTPAGNRRIAPTVSVVSFDLRLGPLRSLSSPATPPSLHRISQRRRSARRR